MTKRFTFLNPDLASKIFQLAKKVRLEERINECFVDIKLSMDLTGPVSNSILLQQFDTLLFYIKHMNQKQDDYCRVICIDRVHHFCEVYDYGRYHSKNIEADRNELVELIHHYFCASTLDRRLDNCTSSAQVIIDFSQFQRDAGFQSLVKDLNDRYPFKDIDEIRVRIEEEFNLRSVEAQVKLKEAMYQFGIKEVSSGK